MRAARTRIYWLSQAHCQAVPRSLPDSLFSRPAVRVGRVASDVAHERGWHTHVRRFRTTWCGKWGEERRGRRRFARLRIRARANLKCGVDLSSEGHCVEIRHSQCWVTVPGGPVRRAPTYYTVTSTVTRRSRCLSSG